MSGDRVAAAFALVQKVLGTKFEINVSEGVENEGAIVEIDRTFRGKEDRGAFCVNFDAKNVSERSDDELLGDALHEWLHAMQYDAWEAGQAGRRGKAAQLYREAHESGVHALERSLLPLLLRAKKRRMRCRKPSPSKPPSSPAAPPSSGS